MSAMNSQRISQRRQRWSQDKRRQRERPIFALAAQLDRGQGAQEPVQRGRIAGCGGGQLLIVGFPYR